MDPITLIVTALAAGAASGTADAAAAAVKGAYAKLRALVANRLGGRPDAELVLTKHEQAPEVWRAPLMAELADAAADRDLDLVRAAQALMALVDEAGTAGKYTVDARGAQGVQVGDHARQDNVFNAPPGSSGARETGQMAESSSRTDPLPGAAPWGQGSGRDEYTIYARGGMGVQVGAGSTQNIYSSQSFCRCGNSIRFQCQICEVGMCWSCDVIEWRQRNPARSGFPDIVVPTPGIGYLKKIDYTGAEWSIDDNRIMQVQSVMGTIAGPFVYADDVLPGLIEAHGLRHVCCACVTAAAVTAAEMIVSGTMCRVPGCCLRATEACVCCGGSFCGLSKGPNPHTSMINGDWTEFGVIGGNWKTQRIKWYPPPGLCLTCAMEQVEALDEKVVSRLENYGLVAHGNWGSHPVFRIPVWQLWQKKASRRQRAEYERAEEKATQMEGRCYAEIQALIDQSATVARQCEHAQWFAAAGTLRLSSEARGDSRLPIRRYTGYIYAIVGEREQAPHTAAESP